jgi:hypothetical protein
LNQNEPEVDTYISGLSTPLSAGQITKLNTFVSALKTGLSISALSDAFDVMYILGGETAESSLRNLVKNSHHAEAVNSPTFTQFEGLTGNSISQAIKTNYSPDTNKAAMSQDSASIGIYSRSNTPANGNLVEIGSRITGSISGFVIQIRATNGPTYMINDSVFNSISNSDVSTGLYIATRNTNNLGILYRNKIKKGENTDTSTTPNNIEVYIMALNTSGTITGYTDRQLSFGFIGRGLSQDDVNSITDAIEAYMDSNGKGVIA